MLDVPVLSEDMALLGPHSSQKDLINFRVASPTKVYYLALREIIYKEIKKGSSFIGNCIFKAAPNDQCIRLVSSKEESPTLFPTGVVYFHNNPIPHLVEPFKLQPSPFGPHLWIYKAYFL